jgi:hypothetical protein
VTISATRSTCSAVGAPVGRPVRENCGDSMEISSRASRRARRSDHRVSRRPDFETTISRRISAMTRVPLLLVNVGAGTPTAEAMLLIALCAVAPGAVTGRERRQAARRHRAGLGPAGVPGHQRRAGSAGW